MRKTKLVILPTRCLNNIGFLLLFLSCPVIGDLGRIRPDTEMSQWSIILEREGTCGLVRGSPWMRDSQKLKGLMEYDLAFTNNTIPHDNCNRQTEFDVTPLSNWVQVQSPEQRIESSDARTVRIDSRRTNTDRRIEYRQKKSVRSISETRNRSDRKEELTRRVISMERRKNVEYDRDSRRTERAHASRRLTARIYQTRKNDILTRNAHESGRSNTKTERRDKRLSDGLRVKTTDRRAEPEYRDSRLVAWRLKRQMAQGRSVQHRAENMRDERSASRMLRRDMSSHLRQERSEDRQVTTRVNEEGRILVAERRSGEIRTARETEDFRRSTIEGAGMRGGDRRRSASEDRSGRRNLMERSFTMRGSSEERRTGEGRHLVRKTSERESIRRSRSEERQTSRRTSERRGIYGMERGSRDIAAQRRSVAEERKNRNPNSKSVRNLSEREPDESMQGGRRLSRSLSDLRRGREVESVRMSVKSARQRDERLTRRERMVEPLTTAKTRVDIRREASNAERRNDVDMSRRGREEYQRTFRRDIRDSEKREAVRIFSRSVERRDKMGEQEQRYSRLDTLTPGARKTNDKSMFKQWRLLDGLRNLIHQKQNEESEVTKYGDFATTCLVGAAAYYLTNRQIKSID